MEAENESGKDLPATETSNSNKSRCSSRCRDDGERCHRCCGRRHRWLGALLILGIIGFLAHSAYYGRGWGCSPWHDHGGYHQRMGGERFGGERFSDSAPRHLDWVVSGLLSDVNASAEQKTKVRTIADAALVDLQKLSRQHKDSHTALLAILKAPTVDRSKIESLRTTSVQGLDEASKRLSVALADLAEVLTPEQRQQLADSAERWHRY